MNLSELPTDVVLNIFRIAMCSQLNECDDVMQIMHFMADTGKWCSARPYPYFNLPLVNTSFSNAFRLFQANQAKRRPKSSQKFPHDRGNGLRDELRLEIMQQSSTETRVVNCSSMTTNYSHYAILHSAAMKKYTRPSVHSVFLNEKCTWHLVSDETLMKAFQNSTFSLFNNLSRLEIDTPSQFSIQEIAQLKSTQLRRLHLKLVSADFIPNVCKFLKSYEKHKLTEVTVVQNHLHGVSTRRTRCTGYLYSSVDEKTSSLSCKDLGEVVAHLLEGPVKAASVEANISMLKRGEVQIPIDRRGKGIQTIINSYSSWESKCAYCEPCTEPPVSAFNDFVEDCGGKVVSAHVRSNQPYVVRVKNALPLGDNWEMEKECMISAYSSGAFRRAYAISPGSYQDPKLVSAPLIDLLSVKEHSQDDWGSDFRIGPNTDLSKVSEISICDDSLRSKRLLDSIRSIQSNPLVCHINLSHLDVVQGQYIYIPTVLNLFKNLKNVQVISIHFTFLHQFDQQGKLCDIIKAIPMMERLHIHGTEHILGFLDMVSKLILQLSGGNNSLRCIQWHNAVGKRLTQGVNDVEKAKTVAAAVSLLVSLDEFESKTSVNIVSIRNVIMKWMPTEAAWR